MKSPTIASLLLCLATTAGAAEPALYEVTLIAGWQVGGQLNDALSDSDRDLDEAAVYGMIFNMQHDRRSQWELYLSRQSTKFDTDPELFGVSDFDLDVDYYHVGGNLEFDGPVGTPFVAASLGATRLQPDDRSFDSSTRFSFSLGGGLKVPFNDRVAARLELRALATVMNNDTDLFCISDSVEGICAVELDGRIFWQVAATAGIAFRFH